LEKKRKEILEKTKTKKRGKVGKKNEKIKKEKKNGGLLL
jgi:hypothetical protein